MQPTPICGQSPVERNLASSACHTCPYASFQNRITQNIETFLGQEIRLAKHRKGRREGALRLYGCKHTTLLEIALDSYQVNHVPGVCENKQTAYGSIF